MKLFHAAPHNSWYKIRFETMAPKKIFTSCDRVEMYYFIFKLYMIYNRKI